MTVGIALLGTGRITQREWLPALQAVDGTRLVAVLSREQARGAAFAQQYGIPEAYDDLDTLLRNPQVDAVIVATPDATHEPQVIAAARAGKHVLCEKPMTTTFAGCERMAEAIRASGITFSMGQTMRFNRGLQCVNGLVVDGEIGQVRYARALWTVPGTPPWRRNAEQGYWALSAVGEHLIDLWRWYFGEPASVGGCLAAPVHHGPNDEVTTLVFDYPGRLLAELSVAAIFGGGNRLELYGDNGAIIAEGIFGPRPAGTFSCNGRTIAYEEANPWIGELADFVQAIEQRREPCATVTDGLRNVFIMETARAGGLQRPL